jgi:hypothetical protein
MEIQKICSFFGHRQIDLTEELYRKTYAEILNSVDFGCRTFYFGGYGEFDRLCYDIINSIRTEKPTLSLWRVFCVPQERYLYKRVRYFRREDYDEVIFLPLAFDWWYTSIYYRNLSMIESSDYIIFYAEDRKDSGAYKAYKYAKMKKDKHVVNLWAGE